MTDKDKIKEEIERRVNLLRNRDADPEVMKRVEGVLIAYNSILQFIDSIPEEPASEDIENEIERFAYSLPHSAEGLWPKDIDCCSQEARTKYGVRHAWSYEKVMVIARHFAEWQKQQMKESLQTEYEKGRFDMREEMMKDALDGCVSLIVKSDPSSRNLFIPTPQLYKELQKYNDGDKLKIIICKTEQQ